MSNQIFGSDKSIYDILEPDEKVVQIDDLLNTRVSYSSRTMDIETILLNLKRGSYELPKYQRKYVWEKKQVEQLMFSLIRNIPIPPIYMYFNEKTGNYVILDGQQRITSIFLYYKSVFYAGKKNRAKIDFQDLACKIDEIEELKLSGKEEESKRIKKEIYERYNIKESCFELSDVQEITFKNLREEARRVLLRKGLDVVFVQCNASNSQQVYAEIFKLLNSAGKELSNQEIRMGIYSDNILYDEIIKFNESCEIWKKIYGNSYSEKDIEYLLRFLALDHFSILDNEGEKLKIRIDFEKNFTLSSVIDKYSEKFNRIYSSKQEGSEDVEQENARIKEEVNKEINKLELFFQKFIDVKDCESVSGGNILKLEGIFVAMSKLGYLEHEEKTIEYESWLSTIKLSRELRSDAIGVGVRLTDMLNAVKEYYN